MSALQPDNGRRRFLTRLFQADVPATTTLLSEPTVRSQGRNVFWALATGSDDAVYLGGDNGVLFRRDGADWQPEHIGGEHNIHALCCIGEDVYSVGWLGQICRRRDGEWQALQGGGDQPDRLNLPLFDIAAVDGNAWAVGDAGRACYLHEDEWIEEILPTSANLRCVLPLEDGRVLAAGLGGTLLERRVEAWHQVETDSGCSIVSIAQLAEDSFVLAGGEYSVEEGVFVGRLFIYRDGDFSKVETGQSLPRLRRVRREGDKLLIVGDGGIVYRWSDSGVTKIPGRERYDLHDILVRSDGEVLICGDGETLLRERALAEGEHIEPVEQCRWESIAPGELEGTLRAMWSVDAGHLIAAGDRGQVLHLRDGQVERKIIPGEPTVHALWGSSSRNILAACDRATIAHFDGQEWSVLYSGEQDTALLAITGFGPHDIFAVGDAGLALRYDGLMWRQLETGTRQELYGLWGQDSSHLLAVGGGGLVLRFDGSAWKSFSAGTEQDIYAVCGTGLQKFYLAGLGGTLIQFEDNRWKREFTGVRSDLHALASDNTGQFYACGSNGAVLRNSDGHWMTEETGTTATLQSLLCVGGKVYAAGSMGTLLRADTFRKR